MAYIVMVYIVMAYTVMAIIVMACIVMAYIVMAYIVMAGLERDGRVPRVSAVIDRAPRPAVPALRCWFYIGGSISSLYRHRRRPPCSRPPLLVHIDMRTDMCMAMHMDACMDMCTGMRMDMCVYTHVDAPACTYAYTHVPARVQAQMPTHMALKCVVCKMAMHACPCTCRDTCLQCFLPTGACIRETTRTDLRTDIHVGSGSALYRHRRQHVGCAAMGVPVLEMTASEAMGVPVLKMIASPRRSF